MLQNGLIERREGLVLKDGRLEGVSVSLVREIPLTIFLNGEELVTLLCTGQYPEDLAIGFLRSEGIIDSRDEVASMRVDTQAGGVWLELKGGRELRKKLLYKRTLGAGCGRASLYYQPLDGLQIKEVAPGPEVSVEQIQARMREMATSGLLYREARATHAASLASPDRTLVLREDIGRHNAVDMIVGCALKRGISLEDKILLTTGRASSEIVLKAARVGIPIVVSRSAATALGVALAERVGMTLVGSVRGGKLTVYSHPQRIP